MVALHLQEALDAMEQVVDITPEQSETKVVAYQNSVILTHRLLTIIACIHCGQVKNAFVHPDNGLTDMQNAYVREQLGRFKRCACG